MDKAATYKKQRRRGLFSVKRIVRLCVVTALTALAALGAALPLFGADVARLDHPASRGIDFDFFPFVIVGVGIAIGVFWSRRRKNPELQNAESIPAKITRRKSGSAQARPAK